MYKIGFRIAFYSKSKIFKYSQFIKVVKVIADFTCSRQKHIFKKISMEITAKSLQSCPTLSDPVDCNPRGSSIYRIFQAKVLEWGAIPFSEWRLLLHPIQKPWKQIFKCFWMIFLCMCTSVPSLHFLQSSMGFPAGSVVKNPPANAGDTRDAGSVPALGRSPGEGNDNPLQYSCLEKSMDRGAWWATVHVGVKNWTWRSTHSLVRV